MPNTRKGRSSIALALAQQADRGHSHTPLSPTTIQDPVQGKPILPGHKVAGLPTPPNSISPNLPPQKCGASAPATHHVESEVDLEAPRGLTTQHLQDLDNAAGDITPSMLAKHHLPAILLNHGPLALRHIIGYLTTSVPGFSGIPPAKARRMVVVALEGRGANGLPGCLNPDVQFESVGSGQWLARQPRRRESVPATMPPLGLQIPKSHRIADRRSSHPVQAGSSSSALSRHKVPYGSEASLHHHDAASIPEHEADPMALIDEDKIFTSPCLGPSTPLLGAELEEATDEEDWASIGAEALRHGSYPASGSLSGSYPRKRPHAEASRGRGISKRPSAHFAKSAPLATSLHNGQLSKLFPQQRKTSESVVSSGSTQIGTATVHTTTESVHATSRGSSATGERIGTQDREAVEALLKLSAV